MICAASCGSFAVIVMVSRRISDRISALVAPITILLAQAFYYVLDDSVYLAGDVEKRYGIPVFGMLVEGRTGKEQPYGREFTVNYTITAFLSIPAGSSSIV